MKKIDLTAIHADEGKSSVFSFLGRFFPEDGQKQSELDAQNAVILRLEQALGEDFTLIREIKIPGLGTPIPMALVGPPGVYVLYASAVKGSYRARGDTWLKLDNSGNMRNSNPNLPHRTRLYAEAIRKFLIQNEISTTEIEPVLLFSQPEAFVENIKAPIRMVMADGLESYAGSLRLQNPILSPDECATIVRLLSNPEGKLTLAEEIAAEEDQIVAQPVIMPSGEPVAAEPEAEPDFIADAVMRSAFSEEQAAPVEIPIPPVIEEAVEVQAPTHTASVSALLARTHMQSWQIAVLGAFALLDFLVICAGLVFVVVNILQ
jgi:hypothetical protein